MATKKASTKTKKAAPSSAKAKAKDQNKCKDWKAWDDQTPYRPYTLHVTGKCTFPTHGYKVNTEAAIRYGEQRS